MGTRQRGHGRKQQLWMRNAWMLPVMLLGFPLMLKAYIDPGSGSMLLQMLVGGLLAFAAGLRFYWKRITLLVRGSKGGKPNGNQTL